MVKCVRVVCRHDRCALRDGVVCRKARMASPQLPSAQPAALSLLCSNLARPTLSPSYAPLQLIRRSLPFASPLRFLSSPQFPSRIRSNHALRSVLGVWSSNILSLNALPKCPAFRAMQDIYLTSCGAELCVCRTCDSVKVGSGLVGSMDVWSHFLCLGPVWRDEETFRRGNVCISSFPVEHSSLNLCRSSARR